MARLLLFLFFIIANCSFANVTLPSVFSDHMVLQQNGEVKFWGWANPNETIKIQPSWSEGVYETTASNLAQWELKIKTPTYGGPYSITIEGNNLITINDVLIGEVWLCSGQSNMEMSASWGIKNMDEVEKATQPHIRFFNVPKLTATSPQLNVPAIWEVCTPEIMKNSSAVAYFFAKRLQEVSKGIPVGLLVSAWGGTPAEIWVPENTIQNNAVLESAAKKLSPSKWGPTKPGQAYNAMIHPLSGFSMSGALWHQGESNVGSLVYDQTLTALITSWRRLWQDEFPFYIVQIAPYDDGFKHFGGVDIRNAQRKVCHILENTGLVVISDISTVDDIHPKDKKSVGIRLANLALKQHYKSIEGVVESPEIGTIDFEGKNAILHFTDSEGLYLKTEVSLFEIAGADRVFYPARAKLKDEQIHISSKKVKTPKYVRFAWGNALQSNVFNCANLPASSFTTE
ncbi:sialate O-acetylesterase [Gelidibacter mesophilus]|uniref:sialate O-acetylesterase n=1 Tax=Gelidibacter mesophilus TaxID=169050 RepID=UPI00040A8F6B|nr:sialate O-acetylesterase [Gelidibacter mesophilus]